MFLSSIPKKEKKARREKVSRISVSLLKSTLRGEFLAATRAGSF